MTESWCEVKRNLDEFLTYFLFTSVDEQYILSSYGLRSAGLMYQSPEHHTLGFKEK